MLRGFGKRYFTLASILAYSITPKLHAQKSSFTALTPNQNISEYDENDDPPQNSLLCIIAPLQQSHKVCHCNSIFKKRIRLILLLNHFIPRCPFYTKYFAFRRTGVHPPLLFLF